MPPNPDMQELLRLTRENNHLLHKMRRNAFWGGIIKFVLYLIVIGIIPLWLYLTYLAPVVRQLTDTYAQFQGTGAKAQANMNELQKMMEQFKNSFSGQ